MASGLSTKINVVSGHFQGRTAHIFLFQCPAQCVGPFFVFDKLREILDFFIGGELSDSKIKPDTLTSDASASADGDAGISLGGSFILGNAGNRQAHE